MRRNLATILLAAAVVVAFGLYMIAFSVQFTETAVVTTFGEVTRVIDAAGLQFKWPWPVQRVHTFDKRYRIYESKHEQLLTADKQSIIATIYIAWRIGPDEAGENVVKYFKEVTTKERAEHKLMTMAHDTMRRVVGQHRFEHFVSADAKKMQLDKIEQELEKIMAEQALSKYGIEVKSVGIARLELPEEATKKVFERMKTEREQIAVAYRAEGASRAESIRTKAQQQAGQIRTMAEAEAIRIRGQGEAEAAKVYPIFASNRGLHDFIIRLRGLKKVLSPGTTMIINKNDPLIGSEILDSISEHGLSGAHAVTKGQASD